MSLGRVAACAALLVATMLAPLGPASPAHAGEAAQWTPERTAARQASELASISCPTRHSCTAVNFDGTAVTFDGHTWGKARSADGELGGLAAVSCPSPTFCAAVGGLVASVEVHHHWRAPQILGSGVRAVSCLSAHWCMAVGSGGHTFRYDGKSWHSGARVGDRTLDRVSCATRTFCFARAVVRPGAVRMLEYTGHGWQRQGPVLAQSLYAGLSCGSRALCMSSSGHQARRWNGHRWSTHHLPWVRADNSGVSCGHDFCELVAWRQAVQWRSGWGRIRTIAQNIQLFGSDEAVSCASHEHCVALGDHGQALVLRGEHWRVGTSPASGPLIGHVSCPTASFCMGLTYQSASRVMRDGVWTAVAPPPGGQQYEEVDCTSPQFCLAIAPDGATISWNGIAWSNAAAEGGSDVSRALDCASATYCVATDFFGRTAVWNGSSWTTTSGPEGLVSLSCPAVDDCWAGTDDANVTHFDGSTWSPQQAIAPLPPDGENDITLRCGTTTTCAAMDEFGYLYHQDGGAWSQGIQASAELLDCAATSCTAALAHGRVARWDGSTWLVSRAMPRGYGLMPVTLSCPTGPVCFLLDWAGTAWVRH